MFGRKICLDYPGIKRQCSSCYGPHARKYCRSERCGMEAFVKGFSRTYASVPVELYGKLSYLVEQARPEPEELPQLEQSKQPQQLQQSKPSKQSKPKPQSLQSGQAQSSPESGLQPKPRSESLTQLRPQCENRPKLKITLAKSGDGDWSHVTEPSKDVSQPTKLLLIKPVTTVSSVTEGVSSFLSGIRASFRQDNVYVPNELHPKQKTTTHDGKQK